MLMMIFDFFLELWIMVIFWGLGVMKGCVGMCWSWVSSYWTVMEEDYYWSLGIFLKIGNWKGN
jgi:hypothetical protein